MDSKVETIAGELRQRIKSGEFGRAGRIPPQRALCDYYNVSRDTINRAIKILEAEGLLVTQGKSTYTHLPIRLPAFVSNYDDYIRARGLEPISEFIEPPNMVTPPSWAAEWLNKPASESVPHRRLRQGIVYSIGRVYYRLSENFYNPDLITDQIFSQLQADPFFNTWTALRQAHGIEIVTSRNRAFVRLPTVEEQHLLAIDKEMPVLELRRVQLAEADLPVMVNRLIFISGRFELFFEASPASQE
jgi:DNA-binding GntR family transcriptional regulator